MDVSGFFCKPNFFVWEKIFCSFLDHIKNCSTSHILFGKVGSLGAREKSTQRMVRPKDCLTSTVNRYGSSDILQWCNGASLSLRIE